MRLPQELIKYKTRFVIRLWGWNVTINYGMPADDYEVEMNLDEAFNHPGLLAGLTPHALVDPMDFRADGSRDYFATLGYQHVSSWSMQLFHHQVSLGENVHDWEMLCRRSYLCIDGESYDMILDRCRSQWQSEVFEPEYFVNKRRRYLLTVI